MIDFNVNDYVHVKLTEVGIDELKRQHAELKEAFPKLGDFTLPKTDEDGWSKWQMHDLMNRFGGLCRPTMNVPFETNIKICINPQ